MKTLRSKIFFLTVFLISGIQNELSPDAENVCLESETYEETTIETVKIPSKEYKKARCNNFFKGFACKKKMTNWKAVDKPRVVQKSKTVLKCCSGYKEIQENTTRCVPVCSTGCVHGECTAPDTCTCMPGFHGQACSMRSVVESYAQKIFHKTELENLTLMPEISKGTNADSMKKTTSEAIGSTAEGTVSRAEGTVSRAEGTVSRAEGTVSTAEGTVSTAEATVTITDAANYERSTTELDEREISKEKFQNGKFTIEVDFELSLPTLITPSTKETRMNAKYSPLKETAVLENDVPNSSEVNTEGNEIPSNTKPPLGFEERVLEPTKIYGENLRVYDFNSLLYVLPVSCLIVAIALWVIVKHRRKIRESQKQNQFYSKEPLEFCTENLFWSKIYRNHSENSIGMSEPESNSSQPILLGVSQRNRSESPMNMWEAEPNNAKPLRNDLQDCNRTHAIHFESTCI